MSKMASIQSDDYYMKTAFLTALRSEDPDTKVGACIVDNDGKFVGWGYNRMPRILKSGCESYSWKQRKDENNKDVAWLDSKYPYVLHAEMDAILNKTCLSLDGCTMYTLLLPGYESAKLMVESGIKRVVYYDDKYPDRDQIKAAEIMFEKANVDCDEFSIAEGELKTELKEMAKKTVERNMLSVHSQYNQNNE